VDLKTDFIMFTFFRFYCMWRNPTLTKYASSHPHLNVHHASGLAVSTFGALGTAWSFATVT